METEYLCLTIVARYGESEPAFKTRISEFWSGIVRGNPDLFEKVYAETSAFEIHDKKPSRKYLVEAIAAGEVVQTMTAVGMDCLPLDSDDLYTKYEAAPPDWFWIEH